MKRIPISAGKEIAKKYGYDQVIIIARNEDNTGWLTTYGKNKQLCRDADYRGKIITKNGMGWNWDEDN